MQDTASRSTAATLPTLMGEGEWATLRERMDRRSFEPGDVIIAQGTLEPDFHIIAEGVVSIVAMSPQGERRELGALGAEEAIGDMSLLTGEAASADVIATTRVTTYAASPERIATLGEVRAKLMEALASLLARRLRRANDRLLAHYSATTHVIGGSREALAALTRLPAEIARCVNAPVMTVVAGDDAIAAWTSEDLRIPSMHDVTIRLVPSTEIGDIPRLISQISHEYDQIIIFTGSSLGEGWQSNSHWQVIGEGERAPSGASLAVVTPRPWTQPTLRALSERAGRPVLAVVPTGPVPPGPRDPIAKFGRVMTGKLVGVALGAGAAKGFAHIGVLRAFEEFGLPIDMLGGCSIGAAIASGYAAGYSVDELTDVASRIASRAVRPTLPLHSFLSNKGIRDELERVGRGRRFEDLDIPLAICATDVYRRCEVTFTSGLVWPCILASMAIPGIYPAMKSSDSYFVDGGVLNPMPARQCRELGAGIVIGVRLTGKHTSPREQLDTANPSRPLAAETIMRCMEIMHNRLSELSKDESDANIEVCIDRGGLRDFDRSAEIVQAGYLAALAARDELRAALPYLKVGA